MKGNRITSVEEVVIAAQAKACLVYRDMRIPAAWIQNWQARYLVHQISAGYIFYYHPKNY